MCMMSVVMAYGRGVDASSWTPASYQRFKDVAAEIETLDVELGEPECVDPEKTTWMRDVEERLRRLEST